MSAPIVRCPACGSPDLTDFHHVEEVPTNSCLLLDDLDEVAALPVGELLLAFCEDCGLITNRAFEPGRTEYSQRYEETQAYSDRFVAWGRALAERWVTDHGLTGATALEIGCGKGEFLEWMVEAGLGAGVGIDPGIHPERRTVRNIEWVRDVFTDDHGPITQDAVVCRHTLEHIHDVRSFMAAVRRGIGDRDIPVLWEVPDVLRVLDEGAFWDLYYEHCTYFSAGSLVRLFRETGFVVERVERDYDDQYLLLEARPAGSGRTLGPVLELEDDVDVLRKAVRRFRSTVLARLAETRSLVDAVAADGGRVVVWGSGSKGVSYLGAMGAGSPIHYAVDINPHKRGRYIAGGGQRIVPPEFLRDYQPSLVVAMNPVYVGEIGEALHAMGVRARLVAV
ncbi:class I SAM-dependent methyltransferase [Euzebya rosea]|uniref:class I SAM-dependent methyltransferase n=1 Tax=Euzebya rosea TaxID=2052804 RepID=UPI000D3E8CAE|nr:class I SAM-dependent methyltransferase [Euzebya rosea]